jgi:hypothetical protein
MIGGGAAVTHHRLERLLDVGTGSACGLSAAAGTCAAVVARVRRCLYANRGRDPDAVEGEHGIG